MYCCAIGEIVEFIAPATPHFLGGLHNIRCLAFYSCRCWSCLKHGHNDHLPCQLLPSVKTDFGQILWHAWLGLSWYTQVLSKHMRLDPFASATPSANCRAADALAVELSTFLCLSPLPSQVTCRLHRGVHLHLLSTYCFTDSLTPLCTPSSSEIRVAWIDFRWRRDWSPCSVAYATDPPESVWRSANPRLPANRVVRKCFLCRASFWLQVKQRALWFAQLPSKPVRLHPCVLL